MKATFSHMMLLSICISTLLCAQSVEATGFQGIQPAPLPLSKGVYTDIDFEGNALWVDYRIGKAVVLGKIKCEDYPLSELGFGHILPSSKDAYIFFQKADSKRKYVLYSGRLNNPLRNSDLDLDPATDGGMIRTGSNFFIQYFDPESGVKKGMAEAGKAARPGEFSFEISLYMWPYFSDNKGEFYYTQNLSRSRIFYVHSTSEALNKTYLVKESFPILGGSNMQYYVHDTKFPIALLGAYDPGKPDKRAYRVIRGEDLILPLIVLEKYNCGFQA